MFKGLLQPMHLLVIFGTAGVRAQEASGTR